MLGRIFPNFHWIFNVWQWGGEGKGGEFWWKMETKAFQKITGKNRVFTKNFLCFSIKWNWFVEKLLQNDNNRMTWWSRDGEVCGVGRGLKSTCFIYNWWRNGAEIC